jgi:hypothetical protein
MAVKSGSPLERPNVSRVLAETREASRRAIDPMTPGRRMEMAFTISLNALRLCMAGLKTQGFSESEIGAIVRAKRR